MDDVEFYLNNEGIISWLDNVGFSNREAIRRKMQSKNSRDYLNLLAVIDELRIGALLSEIESAEYDFNINGKTPDWFVPNTNTIVEVRGTNQIEKDLIRDRFESILKDNIQKIKGSFFVSIKYDSNEDVSFFSSFEHDDFMLKFSVWFSINYSYGNNFDYKGVQITILEEDNELEYLEVGMGNLNFINIDARKLKNIFDEKLKNYKELISKEKKEFIIAIVSDVRNGLRGIDMQNLLYGSSVFNQIRSTKYSSMDGLYYNIEYGAYISGVIFMIRGQKPTFYKNYLNKNNELSSILEKYLTQ